MALLSGERGGSFARLVAVLFVLLLLATAGVFVYTRTQDPLTVSDNAAVGFNSVLADHGTGSTPEVQLEPNGQIYVATTINNEGSLPVTITGLAEPSDQEQAPYIPVEIQLGDGKSTDPGDYASFTPTKLASGSGIGVLIVYAANAKLICSLFTETSEGGGTDIRSFAVRYTTFGIPAQQTLDVGLPLANVARPTKTQCEQATGA